MFANLFSGSTVPALQETINFAQRRHEILAGNIANMETPGYKLRDLSVENFQEKLKTAIELRNENPAAFNSPNPSREAGNGMGYVRDSLKDVLYHDGTDVSIEHQVAELSKNQAMHNTAIAIMTSQFRLLQTAISERV